MTPSTKDSEKWDLINKLINTVRQYAGLPLRVNNNPYETKSKEGNSNDQ